ncbi:hypothetical protein BBF96_05215 [Anoxybacter fermentans]|uniref:Uncharacterized protein n=1 Tax=Anoxybacter fermentans TaxID=1323375 RepID=A0A3Q9HQ25_9FIRM|nr:tetratricopeptide repeat protein [Anoxybacter fermentans]AZR72841.1 hypothetical protein BBF96_05215 [Anoxybacter fermentans]
MVTFNQDILLKLYHQHFKKGNDFFANKDYFQAFLFFAKSLTIGEILNDPKLTVQAKLKIANVQFKSRNLREARNLYTELLEYTVVLSQKELLQIKNRLGITNMLMGRYQKASKIFEELAKNEDPVARRKAYNNMGVLYYYLDTFFDEECMDKAIQNFERAYDLCHDDQLMKHKILRNLGMAFYEKKDYTTALRKFKESLILIEDKVELAHTLNEMAKVYIELHDYEEALKNLREAEKILLNKKYRNLEELSRNIFIHGLLSKKQGRIESAFTQFRTALQGFIEKEIYAEAALVCREIYEMFKDRNPERANFYLDQYKFYLNYLDPMEV